MNSFRLIDKIFQTVAISRAFVVLPRTQLGRRRSVWPAYAVVAAHLPTVGNRIYFIMVH